MKENISDVEPVNSGHDFIRASLVLGCFLLLLFCVLPVSAASQGSGASPEEEIIGVPWEGETGISETVGDIMKRHEAVRYIAAPRMPRVIPFRTMPNREFAPQNPDSPHVSGAPAPDGVGPLIFVRPFTPQTVSSINFTGGRLADKALFPPDTMGAVGPTQYIVAINNVIRSFDKTTGLADGVLNVDPDTFFTSVMTQLPDPLCTRDCTSDIRIRYDRLSGRWFITMIDVPGGSATLPNRIMIAVSSSSTITSLSNFHFFQFQHDMVGTIPNADTGMFADYPTLGIDANALYIGVNVFSAAGPFSNTTGFVVRKSSVLGAGPIVVTPFRNLIGTDGPFTPQGVDNYDPTATQGYFIGVSNASFGRLILRRVSSPGTTPSISGDVSITVPSTSYPLSVPHLGNTGGTAGNLDALDDRLFAAHLRNGNLWTAHNIAVNNSGVGTSGGDRDGSRWYEITDLTDPTPTIVQSGTVFDPTPSNPRFYWIPSIMVSGQGHAALGFSTAGATHHADAATVGRLANDAPGTTEGIPQLYTASAFTYNPPDDPGALGAPRRWGDFSYTSLDPSDDMTMWTIQEFCNATNSYGVQVVKLLAPPPATPVSVSPPTVFACQSSVDIVVTGSSVSGSGFFDPGLGFTNHISTIIGGVTVNSVTYIDPLHVAVNISTIGSVEGSGAVTVTDPDGQLATSPALILNISSPITISPSSIPSGVKGSAYSQTFTPGGGNGSYTLSLTGSLPAGVGFSSGGSLLSGTPTVTGGFPFTISAVDSNGCSGSTNYTLRVAEPDGTITDVRINGTVPAYYDTVQGALDAAINGDSIQMRVQDFIETLLFDNPNNLNPFSITLSGGWDQAFNTNTGTYTLIMGSLTISAGTVTIENVIFH